MEILGSRGPLCGLAGVAVSARRSPSRLAQSHRVVRAGSALVGCALSPARSSCARPLRRAFLLAYLCGFLWYMGNCYWVRDTMFRYGDMPPLAPTLLLIAFSLVLGLYFGLFGLGVMLVRRATRQCTAGTGCGAISLGCARSCGGTHHQRSLGSARLLAGRQRPGQSACPLDRCLWHHLSAGRRQRVADRRVCARPAVEYGQQRVDGERFWSGLAGVTLLATGAAGLMSTAAQSPCSRPPPSSSSPISMSAPKITGPAPANGTATSPSSPDWPASSARPTSLEFRRPAHPPAKSFARRIPRIRISSSGPKRRRPLSRPIPAFSNAIASLARSMQAPLVVGGIGNEYSSDLTGLAATTTRP